MSENTDGFATAEQRDLVQTLATLCQAKQQVVATAESCTGGMIAAAMTHLAGSSAWFDCGFVTYSNNAKMNLLGVSGATLNEFGAVSEATVAEMARGAVDRSEATVACAVSGVAGPGGGSVEKPVGTVWIGWAGPAGCYQKHYLIPGNRDEIRQQVVVEAIGGLINCINSVA
jgi:nicotinamide-nucleotide amidase